MSRWKGSAGGGFTRCNNISINTAGLVAAIMDYFTDVLDEQAALLAEDMKRSVNFSSSGKGEWREELKSKITSYTPYIVGNLLITEAGAKIPEHTFEEIRAMIVSDGAGSAVGNRPIHFGPKGRPVYNDPLTSVGPSQYGGDHDAPDSWNTEGFDWVDDAMSLMKMKYDAALQAAWASLPDSIFYNNVVVSG